MPLEGDTDASGDRADHQDQRRRFPFQIGKDRLVDRNGAEEIDFHLGSDHLERYRLNGTGDAVPRTVQHDGKMVPVRCDCFLIDVRDDGFHRVSVRDVQGMEPDACLFQQAVGFSGDTPYMGNFLAAILGSFIIQLISYFPQLTGLSSVIPPQFKQILFGLILVVMA